MIARGRDAQRWPTTAGGTASTPAQWAAAEAALADALTPPDTSGRTLDGGSLAISYVPFTDWGRDEGLDLSWEVQADWGTRPWRPTRVEIGAGATLVEALEDLLLSRQVPAQHTNAVQLRSAAATVLEQQWVGWSSLLARAAAVASRGPASADEPSSSSVDMVVRWDDHRPPPHWGWEVTVPWIDTRGSELGAHRWLGDTPAEALRTALADAREWYRPTPAKRFGRRTRSS
ncbi:hypothetical protein ASG41_03230 [Modestobacter sp. Leaf380]|nr:hypothetical protein ASG41_03230 [Modestobacter sp. Leaf380]